MPRIDIVLFVAILFLASDLGGGGLRAYLDPGTGSIALQLIIGSVVAVLAAVRLYWDRLKGLARGSRRRAVAAKKR